MSDFEREDMELATMMGGKFVDETREPVEMPVEKPTAAPVAEKHNSPVKNVPGNEKPVTTQWEPVKPAPNFMDKLKAATKEVGVYAVMSIVLFWWQQTGRIDEVTSWYALLVCVGLTFFSIGKMCRGGVK